MQFKFCIEANTAAELKKGVIDYCKTFGVELEEKQMTMPLVTQQEKREVQAAPVQSAPVQSITPVAEIKNEAAKRGRPAKKESNSEAAPQIKEAPAAAPLNFLDTTPQAAPAQVQNTSPAPAGNLTIEDVTVAMRKVTETKSFDLARKILADFKATSLSKVNPADYSKFIAACSAAVI